jgi:16S rRNA (guanine527-N7)-methyltransferase
MQVVPRETDPRVPSVLSHRLLALLKNNGLDPTDDQSRQLATYRDLLLSLNKQVNLISRSASEIDVEFAHLFHSLSPFFFLSLFGKLVVMDLGSGGGLPGIPLAIVRPEYRVVLVDSIAKKARAVESIVNELALPNVRVVNARAEDLLRGGLVREKFDLVLARAVAPLSDLVRWVEPLVRYGAAAGEWRQDGRTTPVPLPALMAWKGGDLAAELAALKQRPGLQTSVFPLVFPGSDEAGLEEKKLVTVAFSPGGGRT